MGRKLLKHKWKVKRKDENTFSISFFVMSIETIMALMDLRNFDKATENVLVAKVI
jgi:hypothetical protein